MIFSSGVSLLATTESESLRSHRLNLESFATSWITCGWGPSLRVASLACMSPDYAGISHQNPTYIRFKSPFNHRPIWISLVTTHLSKIIISNLIFEDAVSQPLPPAHAVVARWVCWAKRTAFIFSNFSRREEGIHYSMEGGPRLGTLRARSKNFHLKTIFWRLIPQVELDYGLELTRSCGSDLNITLRWTKSWRFHYHSGELCISSPKICRGTKSYQSLLIKETKERHILDWVLKMSHIRCKSSRWNLKRLKNFLKSVRDSPVQLRTNKHNNFSDRILHTATNIQNGQKLLKHVL